MASKLEEHQTKYQNHNTTNLWKSIADIKKGQKLRNLSKLESICKLVASKLEEHQTKYQNIIIGKKTNFEVIKQTLAFLLGQTQYKKENK